MTRGSKPPNKPKSPVPAGSKGTSAAPVGAKSSASATAVAKSTATAANAAKPGPCKLATDPSGQYKFQIRAEDMPVGIKLCENHQGNPATTSTFNGVDVRSLSTKPPTVINGQPPTVGATAFSLTLPIGEYYIGMSVNPLPTSVIAYVYEDCTGSNQLTDIQTGLQQLSGYFTLRVV